MGESPDIDLFCNLVATAPILVKEGADRRVLPAPLCFVLRHVKHPVFSPSRKKSAFFFVK